MMGSTSYITKPFALDELLARFRAVLRRTKTKSTTPKQPYFDNGYLKIDFVTRQVTVAGNEVTLTRTEYELLQELVLNTGKVLTYDHLLNRVWGPEYGAEREYVHLYTGYLRAKIETDPKHPKYIISIRGVGYVFRSNPEEP
jgi:two-component system KDP operon response regulator KdpE